MLEAKSRKTIKRRTRKTLAVLFAVILLVQCMTPGAFAAVTVETAKNAGALIAAAHEHSMALKPDGTVAAWGDYHYGQCDVPSGLGDAVAIAGGFYHSMALKSDGTVAAWGDNDDGQRSVPSGLGKVVAIAAGGFHSMALTANGTVAAWGNNENGECDVPSGLIGVVAVSAGSYHSMALKSDGTVKAWGRNNYGQCDVPSGLGDVVAIAAGTWHSVVLKADGTVAAWGDNSFGKCDVPSGLGDVVAIAVGGFHSMVLKADGTVAVWGRNNYDQCNVPSGLTDVVAISAGSNHSMALKADGTVVAWGDNRYGKCNVPPGLNLSRHLDNLLIDNGAWPLDFDRDTLAYTLEVPNAVGFIGISPFADADIQIKVQGVVKASGSTTDIPLNMGQNTIIIDVVKNSTGLYCTYTITVTRATASYTNANLYKLETGTGVLSPAFDPDTTAYTVSVGNTISSIDITARPEDGSATTTINGQSVGTGEQTVSVPLDIGDNVIPIEVRAGNVTTTKDYTITVVRGPSSNAGLSALSVDIGTLSPAFDADTVAYSVQTADSIRSIDITAVTAEPGAELTIGGQTAQSNAPKTVSLDNGANLIPIVITAPDGATQKSYILSVNGTVSDADLTSLSVSGLSLNETFSPGTTDYTLGVGNGVDTLELTATTSDDGALMIIDGAIVGNGNSTDIPLGEGENTAQIMVVAQNASTKTYTLTVTREGTLTITTDSLPLGIIGAAYSVTLEAAGGSGGYTWGATGLPGWLALSADGVLGGTPDTDGQYSIDLTVTDANSNTATKTLTLTIKKGCGNGAYVIETDGDGAYTGGYSDDGLLQLTVNSGVSGFTYFRANISTVTGHTGNEICVFIHIRNGAQKGFSFNEADYDTVHASGAAFNVQPGDVIEVYIVDALSNGAGTNPAVL